ncbi:MAG: electron transport complex subunit RsxC [Spirochaetaceae bacterium]|nr:electron transport complex subunit RsxC [Spirochaetaceae bacterium]
MNRFSTFARGGIHPPEGKGATSNKPIRNAPLPAIAVVPFSQHIGAPAKPLVEPGDHVEEAQIIGEPAGFVSASVHSPIPGTVTEIKSLYLPSGIRTTAAVIELDGEFSRLGKPVRTRDWSEMGQDEILEILKQHGVVGQGGATFPSHVKFSIPKGRSCEIFLVNAAECEPYLSADHRVMLEHTEDIIEGIRIIKKLLDPVRIIIGVEANKPDAIEKLKDACAADEIEVMPLKVKYPQGAEKNLIEAILGREVPSGKLPIEVGVINANVGTLVSVCEAVRDDKPVIERVVTVAGGAIAQPGNIRARVGSSIRDLIEECGGLAEEPEKFVSGGPLMGFTFIDLDSPVTKGTSGILALTKKEVKSFAPTACLSCGRCVESCPMGLVPTTIFKNVEHERLDEATAFGLDDCVLCGACAYVCPSHIPLVSAFKAARGRIRRLAAMNKG